MSIDLIQDHWTSEQNTFLELALTRGQRRINQHSQTVNLTIARSATPWRLETTGKNTFRNTALGMHQQPILINDDGAMQVSSMSISLQTTDTGDEVVEITLGPVACRLLGLIEEQPLHQVLDRVTRNGRKVDSTEHAPDGNVIYLAN